jgi:hypothetical protein
LVPLKCLYEGSEEESSAAGNGSDIINSSSSKRKSSRSHDGTYATPLSALQQQQGNSKQGDDAGQTAAATAAPSRCNSEAMPDPFARCSYAALPAADEEAPYLVSLSSAEMSSAGVASSDLQEQQQQRQGSGLKDADSFSFPAAAITAEAATSAPSALESAAAAAAGSQQQQQQPLQQQLGAQIAAADEQEQQQQQPPPVRRSRTLPRSFNYGANYWGPGSFSSAGSFGFGGAAAGGSGQPSKHTVDQLLRMMMAFTIMQGGGQGNAGEGSAQCRGLMV